MCTCYTVTQLVTDKTQHRQQLRTTLIQEYQNLQITEERSADQCTILKNHIAHTTRDEIKHQNTAHLHKQRQKTGPQP